MPTAKVPVAGAKVPSAGAGRFADDAQELPDFSEDDDFFASRDDDYDDAPQRENTPAAGKRRIVERRRRKPWSTSKKVILSLLCLLAAVLLALGIKFVVDVTNPVTLFNDSIPKTPMPIKTEPTASPDTTPAPGEPTPLPTPDAGALLMSQADLEFMKNRVNVLVLGIDESTERANWGSYRTDTIILVTIDFNTNNVDMISIPRDSFVKLYDANGTQLLNEDGLTGKMAKVNSAFPEGGGAQKHGFEYAMMTASKLLGGVPINYYVGFNMNVVKQMVDAMGGVDYDVDINVSMNGRTLSPGFQHLDGQQVLDYCRQRKGSSDIARVDRQQRMIMAIFKQLKSSGQIANIPTIYQALESNIQTNLSFTQISSLALLALNMDMEQLNKHTIAGGFLNMAGMSYWGVNTEKLKKLVSDVFGYDMTIDPEIDIENIEAALTANREAIAMELATAQSALDSAEAIKTKYGSAMDATLKAQLESAVSAVQNAVEQEDKTLLDTYTPYLVQITSQLLAMFEPALALPTPTPDTGFGGFSYPTITSSGGFDTQPSGTGFGF